MEKLQQLLKQQSSIQQNSFIESQNHQIPHGQHVANDNNNDNDESLQEFSEPNNNNINNHHQTTTKLQQQIPSPIQQKQSTKHEFSVRQSKLQESPQPQQKSPPPVEQPVSLQNTHEQQEEALEQQFTRKFRQSWRNTPDNLPTNQLKKATKLSENDISSQGDDEQDMTEDDIYKLHEELENTRLQNNEMKIALDEARTIIDQQQNQLTEFRRCTAQYQTDAEAFKNDDVQHEEIPTEIIATINNLHVEKTTWKLYASSLVRSFVENCEEFIRKTPYNEPYFESDGERRWYSYSMYLLENLLQIAPYLLSKSDLDLLERSTKHTTKLLTNYHSNEFSTNYNIQRRTNEPELLTTSDFPSSMSRVQLRNSYSGNVQATELAQYQQQQQQQVDQGYGSYSRKSKPLQQKVSERAARAASRPLSHFYRNKK
ncbi:hypothetical protein MN116_007728 [Schistosoma mekongi]|uniref:Uncharacterized protein n=1 Tax=Schistosoma mekongi TaxID=38744 RepID=A0AAE1Z6M8_SCHME|nr:hypothetical protein MN116_007728 [Schistosoma mekongi]